MNKRCVDCEFLKANYMECYVCSLPMDLLSVHKNIVDNVKRGVYGFNKCPHFKRRKQ